MPTNHAVRREDKAPESKFAVGRVRPTDVEMEPVAAALGKDVEQLFMVVQITVPTHGTVTGTGGARREFAGIAYTDD